MAPRSADRLVITAPSSPGVAVARRWLTAERIEMIALAAFVLFIVWPFLHRTRLVLGFDGLAYSGPNLQITLDAYKSGELPLWNHLIFGGVSHAGNPQTSFWYPVTALGLPFSTTRALNVLTVVHLVLFAAGMVALCRWQLKLRPPATFVGTAVALGCGAMASKTIQFEQLLVVAWVPLLLALLHWLISGDRPLRAAGCVALVTAAWLTAGHPQMEYITAPLLLVWTVAIALDTGAFGRLYAAAGAALLGAVIALPHLVLTFQATGSSALSGGRTLDDIRALGWLQGRTLVPGLLGNPSALNPAFLTHDFESTTYIGVAAAVLAVVGLVTGLFLRYRRWTTVALGSMAALFLLLATGPITPVFRLAFSDVPGFDLARVAARWVLPASLCLAVLAAYGVDAARDADLRQRRAAVIGVIVAGAGAAVAALAYPDQVPGRRVAATWIVVGGATLVGWAWRPRSPRAIAACLLIPIVLVGGELGIAARHSFARGVMTTNAPESATSDALTFLRDHPEGRTLAFTFDELGDPSYLAPALRPNVNATFGIASIDGYDGGVQITKRWAAVFGAQIPGFDAELTLRAQIKDPMDPTTWARLGLRYVLIDSRGVGASLLPGWNGPLVTGDFEVYENPAWIGDAIAWKATTPVSSVEEAAGLVLADPTSTAVNIEAGGDGLVCTTADCSPVGLPVVRHSSSNVSVQTDLDAPTVVAIDEQPDDGWHATVDGEPAAVLAVDGIQIGVAVPAGAHDVHFTYRPDDLTESIIASLVGVLVALLLIVGLFRRNGPTAQRWSILRDQLRSWTSRSGSAA
jgi:hypothetical protein